MSKRSPLFCTRENSAVLLIDYQEKFVPVLFNNSETIKNIKLLLAGVNIYSLPVWVSEQVPDKLGPTINDFKDLLTSAKAKFFSKKTMSCCGEADFVSELKSRNISKVVICGVEAHVCALQTALDLIEHGFQVHFVIDAITSRIAYNKEIAIDKVKQAGGIITSVETVLFEIAYTAGTEEFKKLQGLFKN